MNRATLTLYAISRRSTGHSGSGPRAGRSRWWWRTFCPASAPGAG